MTQERKKALRVIPLGGLDGIGKNMTVLEYDNDMIVIDAGLMFPDDDHPGIDLILPDYSYLIDNAEKLRGIVVTHGHEDHTGALPYLLKDLDRVVPIIATKLTLGLIKGKLEEHGVKKVRYHEIKDGVHMSRGVFGLDFIAVNHSIPDAIAVCVRTPVGNVLHTGDFKFDQTPIDGRLTDYAALAKLGRQGVMLLMSDSTNAEHADITRSEAVVGRELTRIISQAKGSVIVASFASHIHRLQQVADAAAAAHRKVVVTGRSMLQNVKIARDMGYLTIKEDDLIDAYELKNLRPEEVVIMCTGSQGEPLSALARMAMGEHRTISIGSEDTIILSASPVPGNEKAVGTVINRLMKIGADVYDKDRAEVHVSGHASAEELKLMLNLIKPEYFVPVHGETRHLVAHKELALAVGIPENYIFVLDNGDVLEFTEEGARIAPEQVSNGVKYVDGLNVGDSDQVVIRDRQHLSQDGIITLVLSVNRKQGSVVGQAEIVARGVVFPEDRNLENELLERAKKAVRRATSEHASLGNLRKSIRDSASQLVWESTKRRPMVIPVIIEV
ncbi:MAG: ribonuclease J [Coriobacteriia bacterium]|nr:ribonuclease J [Coriobacteriia bacterium]